MSAKRCHGRRRDLEGYRQRVPNHCTGDCETLALSTVLVLWRTSVSGSARLRGAFYHAVPGTLHGAYIQPAISRLQTVSDVY